MGHGRTEVGDAGLKARSAGEAETAGKAESVVKVERLVELSRRVGQTRRSRAIVPVVAIMAEGAGREIGRNAGGAARRRVPSSAARA
jgi:hypothetical protein